MQTQIPLHLNLKDFFEKVKKESEEGLKEEEYKDRELAELVASEGWKKFEEKVEERIAILKSMIDPDTWMRMIDTEGDPFLVGLKYLMVSFAIYQIKRILEIPEAISKVQILNEQRKKR